MALGGGWVPLDSHECLLMSLVSPKCSLKTQVESTHQLLVMMRFMGETTGELVAGSGKPQRCQSVVASLLVGWWLSLCFLIQMIYRQIRSDTLPKTTGRKSPSFNRRYESSIMLEIFQPVIIR